MASLGRLRDGLGHEDRSADPLVRLHTPSEDTVHSGCGLSLERVKAFPQQIDCQMVEQGGELPLLIVLCRFPHARQPLGHALPALCRVRVRLTSVLLGWDRARRASYRWRVTVLALSVARRVHNSTMATFRGAPR